MSLRLIDAQELSSLLPMPAAIDALDRAFASGAVEAGPQRTHVSVDEGAELLVMPAVGSAGIGVKLVTIAPANPGRGLPLIHGLYVLFAPGTLETVGVIDGSSLTGLRTAAVSGVATRHLARDGAHRLVLFGAGAQGYSHLDAMGAVRPIDDVKVVSRTTATAQKLVARARSMGLTADVAEPDAVSDADIVCTCTTSDRPVFDGSRLAQGAHVNAVGAYQPHARELDDAVMGRAGSVVVETRSSALAEAGDVVLPLEAGVLDEDAVVELAEVARGDWGRTGDDAITVFKSVGVAFEDLVIARAAFGAA
ncbi:MAG: ornithine cyclodeaminase family protein [Actinomycetota bacterium]